jgi:hypothetical protein
MGPQGSDCQDQPSDSDESILARTERARRQIVNFHLGQVDGVQIGSWGIVHSKRYRFASRDPRAATGRAQRAVCHARP